MLRMVMRNWQPIPLTCATAASMVGVEPETLWRWCDGRSIPKAEQMLCLELVFGIAARAWFLPRLHP